MIKAPPADHVDPLYVSVQALIVGDKPPNANAAVFVPAPAKLNLAVIKAPPADQDVPLYASVQATTVGVLPPNANAAVFVPAPARLALAVIKAPPADHNPPVKQYDRFNLLVVVLNHKLPTDPVFPTVAIFKDPVILVDCNCAIAVYII